MKVSRMRVVMLVLVRMCDVFSAYTRTTLGARLMNQLDLFEADRMKLVIFIKRTFDLLMACRYFLILPGESRRIVQKKMCLRGACWNCSLVILVALGWAVVLCIFHSLYEQAEDIRVG